ncbi:DUF4240 domain-containing protein, partial [Bacillus mycoides]|uniref:DUF4240 domain-containing protein n=1 Tax=Bacillus mycoides TaxID=1405 RepID=UPI003A80EF1E
EKTLWEVVEESKAGKEYMTSRTQYKNLEKILAKMDKENVQKVGKEWQAIVSGWYNDEQFNLLHKSELGFVNSGDDGFYMDFANWLVAQGEKLYNDFKENGYEAVVAYKRKHKVAPTNYLFECMGYAFQPYRDEN